MARYAVAGLHARERLALQKPVSREKVVLQCFLRCLITTKLAVPCLTPYLLRYASSVESTCLVRGEPDLGAREKVERRR